MGLRGYLVEAAGPGGGSREVSVDPAGAQVLGVRHPHRHLTAIIYDLHRQLLLGRPGEILLGAVSAFILVALLAGLYLWWPGLGRLRLGLTLKRGATGIRRIFDWHRVMGIYSAAMTPADTYFAWQFPLHNGEAFGLPGRLVVFVSGLVPCGLYVTGILIWARKRRGRARRGGVSSAGAFMAVPPRRAAPPEGPWAPTRALWRNRALALA